MAGRCELVWPDGGQTDFYDREKQVTMAIDAVNAVDRHFRATLAR